MSMDQYQCSVLLFRNVNNNLYSLQTINHKLSQAILLLQLSIGLIFNQANKTVTFAGYINDLMEEVAAGCRKIPAERTPVSADVPPSLCDALDRPEKHEAIAQHRSRFAVR